MINIMEMFIAPAPDLACMRVAAAMGPLFSTVAANLSAVVVHPDDDFRKILATGPLTLLMDESINSAKGQLVIDRLERAAEDVTAASISAYALDSSALRSLEGRNILSRLVKLRDCPSRISDCANLILKGAQCLHDTVTIPDDTSGLHAVQDGALARLELIFRAALQDRRVPQFTRLPVGRSPSPTVAEAALRQLDYVLHTLATAQWKTARVRDELLDGCLRKLVYFADSGYKRALMEAISEAQFYQASKTRILEGLCAALRTESPRISAVAGDASRAEFVATFSGGRVGGSSVDEILDGLEAVGHDMSDAVIQARGRSSHGLAGLSAMLELAVDDVSPPTDR
jgi:hypothetical protein